MSEITIERRIDVLNTQIANMQLDLEKRRNEPSTTTDLEQTLHYIRILLQIVKLDREERSS